MTVAAAASASAAAGATLAVSTDNLESQPQVAAKQVALPSAIFVREASTDALSTSARQVLKMQPPDAATPKRRQVTIQHFERSPTAAAHSPAGTAAALSPPAAMQPGTEGHVWFNSPMNTSIDVTPYSQVYGLHPRFFHFDGSGSMQLTPVAAGSRSPSLPPSPVCTSIGLSPRAYTRQIHSFPGTPVASQRSLGVTTAGWMTSAPSTPCHSNSCVSTLTSSGGLSCCGSTGMLATVPGSTEKLLSLPLSWSVGSTAPSATTLTTYHPASISCPVTLQETSWLPYSTPCATVVQGAPVTTAAAVTTSAQIGALQACGWSVQHHNCTTPMQTYGGA
eukprot:CAMPEP_0172663996 /NCGR_PEP_ID=MMETSP1074-20121228/6296_1 /TAXON_ID=2916 /ORGANISM="Ceratium fusus, Strain PA161109" /LENGTH=334 /DNA_ID=CAMNT_0013480075 /DNA_START=28 /DNA_END=1032 /DNA_ORIENTATION=-